jgi:hypothetical protein
VLRGGKVVCVYGGRRSLGGVIERKEEILRSGSTWCSKCWVANFDDGEFAVVSGGEGLCKVFQGGVKGSHR